MKTILKQFQKLKLLFTDNQTAVLSDEDNLRYQDVLRLMEERGYINNMHVWGANVYRKLADFSGFEEWLEEKVKEENRLSRREWVIGISGACIGLLPFIITTVIPWIIDFLKVK